MIGHGEKYSIPDAKLLSVGRLRFVVTFLVMAISGFMATLGAQICGDGIWDSRWAFIRKICRLPITVL